VRRRLTRVANRALPKVSTEDSPHTIAAKRLSRMLGMFSSLEVKVLRST
jgi:hypothetical protein